MDEHDIALIKSLVGIVSKGSKTEWVYSEDANADVVIVDADGPGFRSKLTGHTPKAIVAYADPDRTLIPNTFALTKPARARELMEVLEGIQTRLNIAAAN